MSNLFANCKSLIAAPAIPKYVKELGAAFSGCTSLKTAPMIGNSVTGMYSTFKGCTALTGTITIGAGMSVNNNCYECFKGVDFQAQNITLAGNGAVLDPLGSTGINYCGKCNGVCSGHAAENLNPDDGSTPQTGDIYRSGNYEYRYNQYYHYHARTWMKSNINGWGVRCINNVADPGQIMESINGEPITNLYNTFYGCTSVKYAPVIPSTVLDMYQTFANCKSLTGTIIINANPNRFAQCFYGVDFQLQNLTLGGASSILGPLKTATT
jgi:hypothetical protein